MLYYQAVLWWSIFITEAPAFNDSMIALGISHLRYVLVIWSGEWWVEHMCFIIMADVMSSCRKYSTQYSLTEYAIHREILHNMTRLPSKVPPCITNITTSSVCVEISVYMYIYTYILCHGSYNLTKIWCYNHKQRMFNRGQAVGHPLVSFNWGVHLLTEITCHGSKLNILSWCPEVAV